MDMFHKQGIKQVRMDDIAKTLSISKRTLYEIFDDKETLLLKCIKRKQEMQDKYMQQFDLSQSNVLEVVLHHYQYTIELLPHVNPAFFEDLAWKLTSTSIIPSTKSTAPSSSPICEASRRTRDSKSSTSSSTSQKTRTKVRHTLERNSPGCRLGGEKDKMRAQARPVLMNQGLLAPASITEGTGLREATTSGRPPSSGILRFALHSVRRLS